MNIFGCFGYYIWFRKYVNEKLICFYFKDGYNKTCSHEKYERGLSYRWSAIDFLLSYELKKVGNKL